MGKTGAEAIMALIALIALIVAASLMGWADPEAWVNRSPKQWDRR